MQRRLARNTRRTALFGEREAAPEFHCDDLDIRLSIRELFVYRRDVGAVRRVGRTREIVVVTED